MGRGTGEDSCGMGHPKKIWELRDEALGTRVSSSRPRPCFPSAEQYPQPHLLLPRLPRPRPPRHVAALRATCAESGATPPQRRDRASGLETQALSTTCPEGRWFSQVTPNWQGMELLKTRKRSGHAERQGGDRRHFCRTTEPPSLGVN